MTDYRTARFHALFDKLPKNIQELAEEIYQLFLANPQHPSLQFKKLNPTESLEENSWSVRINSSYRAICSIQGDTRIWYFIGTHGDYDKITR